jgi:hypothetical protein
MAEIFRICKPGTGWAQIIETSAYLYCDDDSTPKDSKLWDVFPLRVSSDSSIKNTSKRCSRVRRAFCGIPGTSKDISAAQDSWISKSVKFKSKWASGWKVGSLLGAMITVDPKLKAAARAAINVWSGVVGPLVDKMEKWLETEDERTAFTEAVTKDMANPAYHLYSPMYNPLIAPIDFRICAIGRRPNVDLGATGK